MTIKQFLIKVRAKMIKWTTGVKILLTYRPIESRANKPILYLDITSNPWDRHLYALVKFFVLENYEVYLPKRPYLLGDLQYYRYPKLILAERLVRLGRPKSCDLTLKNYGSDKNLTTDYYAPFFKTVSPVHYVIPIAMHPHMYHYEYWSLNMETSRKRINGAFFAGAFRESSYKLIEAQKIFKTPGRLLQRKKLDDARISAYPENYESLFSSDDQLENKVTLVDKTQFAVPLSDLRKTFARFEFFLAFPGVSMPICHNLIESMSAGAIPILSSEYAKLYHVPLEDMKNAIVFDSLENLVPTIQKAFQLDSSQKEFLRLNVCEYFKNNFTSKAVVGRIVENEGMNYFLADKISVAQIK